MGKSEHYQFAKQIFLKDYKDMDNGISNNGYDYVDLGLPSGTLWATCNVGTSKPSESGLYFQWGDTKGYTKEQVGKDKEFNWPNYKFGIDESSSLFSKYTYPGDILELEDDAAHVNMGGDWHIPSPNQIKELINNTTREWIALDDGISGIKFISKKDASKFIIIPVAGCALGGSVDYRGSYGYIWSSTLSTLTNFYGKYLYLDLWGAKLYSGRLRWSGMPVRGVVG